MRFDAKVSVSWRAILITLAVIAVVGGAYAYFTRPANPGATLTVARGDFSEQVAVSGTVTAARAVDLGFAANGRIAHTYAAVGQYVAAGTVLAETENGDLVAILARAQAALAQAQANLASLKAGSTAERIAAASTVLSNAEAALVDAVQGAYTTSDSVIHNTVDPLFTNPRTDPKISFSVPNAILKAQFEADRTTITPMLAAWAALVAKLNATNAGAAATQSQSYLGQVVTLLADANAALNQAVPDQTTSATTLAADMTAVGTARTSLNAAVTALTATQSSATAAEKNLALVVAGPTVDAVAASEAAVAAARAEVENAAAALAKTRIVAPFGGVVTRIDAKAGQSVSPSTADISMQSDGVFEIDTYVPEVSIALVAVGNLATTTLDAYGSRVPFAAKVVAVDPAETLKDGVPTYKTTLIFLAADSRIRSGMTANAVIETGVLHDAIVIPAGAIRTDASGASHVSVLAERKVAPRAVELGATPSLGQVEIRSGLSVGDVILLIPSP